MMIANVSSIELFTRILDGGFTIKCNCGHIHRVVEPSKEYCPNCGMPFVLGKWNKVSIEEYKQSRKDD